MRLVFANSLNKQKTNENSAIETRYSKNLKVAILVEIFTTRQKSSLDTQKKLFTRMCEENNWEIYDIYEEVESGTHTNLKALIS